MKKLKKLTALLLALVILATVTGMSAFAGNVAYGAATVTASVLNIRSGAGTSYSIVGTVSYGEELVILERTSSSWYHINYHGTEGYVSTSYLTNVATAENFDASGKTNVSCYMRSGPSTSYSSVNLLGSGKSVSIIGINNGWFKVTYDGKTGYIRSDLVDITGGAGSSSSSSPVSSSTGVIINYCTRVRSGPSTSYSIVTELNSGTSVTVTGSTNGWYSVQYGSYSGYIRSDLVQLGSSSSSSSSTMYTNSDGIRMRSGPSTGYSILTSFSINTAVTVTGSTNGWYSVNYNGTSGYIRSDLLSSSKTSVSSSGSSAGQAFADMACQYVGYSYVYGGASPSTGFDCSGLVYYVAGQLGYSVSRGAGSQYANNGYSVSKSELQPGDLVFFSSNGYEVTHVGIYIGNNQFVHASTPTNGVLISSLTSSYYTSVYWGAKRIV